MDLFCDTYIERSPSGKGYYILFFSRLNKLPTEQKYGELYKKKNSKLDVKCYINEITNRYFTFTGNQTSEGNCVTGKIDTLLEFLNKYMKKVSAVNSEQLKLTTRKEDENAIDVNSRLEIAINASNGNLFSALYTGDTSAYNSTSEAV